MPVKCVKTLLENSSQEYLCCALSRSDSKDCPRFFKNCISKSASTNLPTSSSAGTDIPSKLVTTSPSKRGA